ncbi:MAG: hypothetical protein ACOYVJ_11650 [Nitrospirota bacterium]
MRPGISIPNSPFSARIKEAVRLHKEFGSSLREDAILRNLLTGLNKSGEDTRQAMDRLGVTGECAECAASEAGTCCGERTGLKCDLLLLLINMLLNITLPVIYQERGSCYFLTPRGCSLRARPVICINYLCTRLRKNIQAEKLISLQQIAGKEMDALFLVEEYLKKTGVFRNYRNSRPAIYLPSSSGFTHRTTPDCDGR